MKQQQASGLGSVQGSRGRGGRDFLSSHLPSPTPYSPPSHLKSSQAPCGGAPFSSPTSPTPWEEKRDESPSVLLCITRTPQTPHLSLAGLVWPIVPSHSANFPTVLKAVPAAQLGPTPRAWPWLSTRIT